MNLGEERVDPGDDVQMHLNTDKHSPLTGSQCLALPKWIKDEKAVINLRDDDAVRLL